MNQILYTGGKNKRGGSSDTKKILLFFVFFIIIFGICLIVAGTNMLSKVKPVNKNETNTLSNQIDTNTTNNTSTENPNTIKSKIKVGFTSQVGAVKVVVDSNRKIASVSYWWDEEEPTNVEPDDTKYEVEIPSKQGTHTLNIKVTDESGYVKTEEQIVIGDSGPELTLSTDGVSNYVINVKDDEEVDRIVIVLNGETQEIKVNSKEFEYKVPIPQGYSLIDVTAYNLNELSTNKKGKITNFGG